MIEVENKDLHIDGQDHHVVQPNQAVDNNAGGPRVRRNAADDASYGDEGEEVDALQRGLGIINPEASKGSLAFNAVIRYAVGDQQEKAIRNAYLKLKKFSKEIGKESGVALSFKKRSSPWSIWSATNIMSSIYDRYEQYPYIEDEAFPYKRAVKLVYKNGCVYATLSNDLDIYGVCVDINEYTNMATVVPIGHSFQGYLVCNYNTNLKPGDQLDFSTIGEVTKAVAPNLPTIINMVALSNSFKLDFRNSLERKDAEFSKAVDYSVALVEVLLFGNRFESKKN